MLRVLVLILWFLLGVAYSRSGSCEPVEMNLRWYLSLDEQGKITKLDAAYKDYSQAERQQIETMIRRWHFTAGRLDDRGARTETTLSVRARFDATDDDADRVDVLSAHTGAYYARIITPAYPDEALRKRREGYLVLRVDFDASGKVTSVAVADGEPRAISFFGSIAMSTVKRWTFRPETIAGQGIAATALVPFCFSLQSDACQRRPEKGGAIDNSEPTPLTSAVGLDISAANRMP